MKRGGVVEPVPIVEIDFSTWIYNSSAATVEITKDVIVITNVLSVSMFIQCRYTSETIIPETKILVEGLEEYVLQYQYCNSEGNIGTYIIDSDGEHILPTSYPGIIQEWTGFKSSPIESCNIKITIIKDE